MPSEKIQKTLAWLDEHGITYEVHYHPAIYTIEDCLAYWKNIEATHCKNLFMRNHKGNRHYLISYECHKNLDIHALEHMLHQGKLSFASPERMDRCLGVAPGSVCAFGLINDIDIADTAEPKELFENGHRVKYFLDKELQTADKVSFHPCDNTASVVLTKDMFMKFLTIWGGEYEWLEINIAFQMPLYPMIDDRDTESSRDNHNKVWNTRLNHFGWKKYLGELYGSDNVPAYAAPARRLYHAFDMLAPGKDVSKEAIGRFEAAFDEARKKYFANNY